MYFFEIIEEEGKQSSAIKVDELKLNASFLNSKKTQDNQEQENADTGEIFLLSFICQYVIAVVKFLHVGHSRLRVKF